MAGEMNCTDVICEHVSVTANHHWCTSTHMAWFVHQAMPSTSFVALIDYLDQNKNNLVFQELDAWHWFSLGSEHWRLTLLSYFNMQNSSGILRGYKTEMRLYMELKKQKMDLRISNFPHFNINQFNFLSPTLWCLNLHGCSVLFLYFFKHSHKISHYVYTNMFGYCVFFRAMNNILWN